MILDNKPVIHLTPLAPSLLRNIPCDSGGAHSPPYQGGVGGG